MRFLTLLCSSKCWFGSGLMQRECLSFSSLESYRSCVTLFNQRSGLCQPLCSQEEPVGPAAGGQFRAPIPSPEAASRGPIPACVWLLRLAVQPEAVTASHAHRGHQGSHLSFLSGRRPASAESRLCLPGLGGRGTVCVRGALSCFSQEVPGQLAPESWYLEPCCAALAHAPGPGLKGPPAKGALRALVSSLMVPWSDLNHIIAVPAGAPHG